MSESTPNEPPNYLRQLDERALAILIDEAAKGCGEPDGAHNNSGPDVERYMRGDGTGRPVVVGSWCGAVQSYADVRAAFELRLRCPITTSRGAKAYTAAVGLVGRVVARQVGSFDRGLKVEWASKPKRGDRICWQRGNTRETYWQGHVARVVAYNQQTDVLTIIQGNANNLRDAKGRKYATVHIADMAPGVWRHRLWSVTRLVG